MGIEMKTRPKAKSQFENEDFREDMNESKKFNIEALNKSILDGTLRKSLKCNKKMHKHIKEEIEDFYKVDEVHPQN